MRARKPARPFRPVRIAMNPQPVGLGEIRSFQGAPFRKMPIEERLPVTALARRRGGVLRLELPSPLCLLPLEDIDAVRLRLTLLEVLDRFAMRGREVCFARV